MGASSSSSVAAGNALSADATLTKEQASVNGHRRARTSERKFPFLHSRDIGEACPKEANKDLVSVRRATLKRNKSHSSDGAATVSTECTDLSWTCSIRDDHLEAELNIGATPTVSEPILISKQPSLISSTADFAPPYEDMDDDHVEHMMLEKMYDRCTWNMYNRIMKARLARSDANHIDQIQHAGYPGAPQPFQWRAAKFVASRTSTDFCEAEFEAQDTEISARQHHSDEVFAMDGMD